MPEDRWLTFHSAAQTIFDEMRPTSKEQLARPLAAHFGLTADRSIFHADDFAVRFVLARGRGLPNTILSLAKIKQYDERPLLVCVLRPDSGVETLLANSTFIDKVSHSSQALTLTNIRGSILGSDISRDLDGLTNTPPHFEALFARHQGLTWEDNLERIVERTRGIAPREKYAPTPEEQARIIQSVREAAAVVAAREAADAARSLYAAVERQRDGILRAAAQDNVNLRGNDIERLITGREATHDFGDQTFALPRAGRLVVDIKSKLRGRASSPKLYNVDKMLRALSDGRTLAAVLLVLVDVDGRAVAARLVNVFDSRLLRATRVQHHWAGRGSRGVTQLLDVAEDIFQPGFEERIDVEAAEQFVHGLMAR